MVVLVQVVRMMYPCYGFMNMFHDGAGAGCNLADSRVILKRDSFTCTAVIYVQICTNQLLCFSLET